MNSAPTPNHRHEKGEMDPLHVQQFSQNDMRLLEHTQTSRRGFLQWATAGAAAIGSTFASNLFAGEPEKLKPKLITSPLEGEEGKDWKIVMPFGASAAQGYIQHEHAGDDLVVLRDGKEISPSTAIPVRNMDKGDLWDSSYGPEGGGRVVLVHKVQSSKTGNSYIWSSMTQHIVLGKAVLNENGSTPTSMATLYLSAQPGSISPEFIRGLRNPDVQRYLQQRNGRITLQEWPKLRDEELQARHIPGDTTLGAMATRASPIAMGRNNTRPHVHIGGCSSQLLVNSGNLPLGYFATEADVKAQKHVYFSAIKLLQMSPEEQEKHLLAAIERGMKGKTFASR